jgi:hypothetical protein
MAARFYFYPQPNGSNLITIDLEEELGELYSDFYVDAVDAVTRSGHRQRSVGRMAEIVTIQRDRLKLSEDLAYQFYALQNHLDRGFSCSFTADHTKAWAAPIRLGVLNTNVQDIPCYRNPFQSIVNPAASGLIPDVGDIITIETMPPGMITEQHKLSNVSQLSSVTGGQFSISKGLNFQYERPAFARYYRFWPVLKRPASQVGRNIITNENGRLFSLNITLEVDYLTLFKFHPGETETFTDFGDGLTTEHVGIPDQGSSNRGLDGVYSDRTRSYDPNYGWRITPKKTW